MDSQNVMNPSATMSEVVHEAGEEPTPTEAEANRRSKWSTKLIQEGMSPLDHPDPTVLQEEVLWWRPKNHLESEKVK